MKITHFPKPCFKHVEPKKVTIMFSSKLPSVGCYHSAMTCTCTMYPPVCAHGFCELCGGLDRPPVKYVRGDGVMEQMELFDVSGRRKLTYHDVYGEENRYFSRKPHGWIQWKGTDVCMDIHCGCGERDHVDAEFFYEYTCKKCKQIYAVGQCISLIPIPESMLPKNDE